MEKQIENQKPNLVLGRVVDRLNHPVANLIVQAYDRDMRSEELLGECITDKEGKYEITWLHSQLSRIGYIPCTNTDGLKNNGASNALRRR